MKTIKCLREKVRDLELEAAVDFDEKLWDLFSVSSLFVKETYGDIIKSQDVNHWNYFKDNYPRTLEAWGDWEWYKKGSPIKGSEDFILLMKYIFGEDKVKIVTASFPGVIKNKTKLIKEIYGIKSKNIHHTSDKSTLTKNAILFDDGLHNIKAHTENNKQIGIIFDRGYGWNQEPIEENCELTFRAKSYQEVFEILNRTL